MDKYLIENRVKIYRADHTVCPIGVHSGQ